MGLSFTRTAMTSIAGAAILSLALVGSAAAQVATLAEPDPNAEESPAPVSEELEGEEAMLEFAQCMRDSGIDMDDPQFGIDGMRFGLRGAAGEGMAFDPESSEFQSAMEACGDLLESMRPEADAEQQAEQAEQQLVLAECMRELDWDFPDPSSTGNFGMTLRESGIDFADPDFQTDMQACQAESGLELGGPGGGAG